MDLRWRLITLLGSLMVLLALAISAVFVVSIQSDTEAEVRASERLARLVVLAAEAGAHGQSPEELRQRVEGLLAEGPIRHLSVTLDGRPVAGGGDAGSGWLAERFGAHPVTRAETLDMGGLRLVIAANPASELQEKLGDALQFCLILLCFAVAATLLIWFSVHRALQPVRELEAALDRLAHGASEVELPAFALQEFQRIATAINQLVVALAQSRAAELALAQRLIRLQDEERRMLARELHDEVGQTLTALGTTAAYLERQAPALPLADIVGCAGEIQRELKTGRAQLRALLRQLNPHALDGYSLPGALRELVGTWQKRSTAIEFTLQLPASLPALDETRALALYRVVQEALTNVVRHAGARHCAVGVRLLASELAVDVSDDGVGMGTALPGIGLTGMLARLDMLGGRLDLSDNPGGGLHLTARLPLLLPVTETCS